MLKQNRDGNVRTGNPDVAERMELRPALRDGSGITRPQRPPVSIGDKVMKLFAQIAPASDVGGFLINLAQHYPWLTTALVVIGALRVLFKPVMALLDGYIKANCSPEEYGRLQHFETGSVYKWVNFALDLVGSIKLPTLGIKPTERKDYP